MKEKIKILYILVVMGLVIGVLYYYQKWQDTENIFSNYITAPMEKKIALDYCVDKYVSKPLEALVFLKKQKQEEGDFMSCVREAQKNPIETLKKMGFE